MENHIEVPPPINLRTTFLGKHGREEDEEEVGGERIEEVVEGEVEVDQIDQLVDVDQIDQLVDPTEKKKIDSREFEPPKKKRKIDTESVDVDQKAAISTEYKPVEDQGETFEDETLGEYSEKPRRSNRKIKKAKRTFFDASDLYDDKINRKRNTEKPLETNYRLKVNGKMEDLEILRERKLCEKDQKEKVNVIFKEENRYETGIFLIGGEDSLTIPTTDFFILLYIASGYATFSINGGDPIRSRPGLTMRIPKGNEIKFENGKGVVARISYTKLYQ